MNTLVIHWKKEIGNINKGGLYPCPKPTSESFKNIRSLEKAKAIISRRNADNIQLAHWGNEILVDARTPKKQNQEEAAA